MLPDLRSPGVEAVVNVHPAVLKLVHDLQILRPVVIALVVPVMNLLVGRKRAPEHGLRDKYVLQNSPATLRRPRMIRGVFQQVTLGVADDQLLVGISPALQLLSNSSTATDSAAVGPTASHGFPLGTGNPEVGATLSAFTEFGPVS